jgi:hypothetical protein
MQRSPSIIRSNTHSGLEKAGFRRPVTIGLIPQGKRVFLIKSRFILKPLRLHLQHPWWSPALRLFRYREPILKPILITDSPVTCAAYMIIVPTFAAGSHPINGFPIPGSRSL